MFCRYWPAAACAGCHWQAEKGSEDVTPCSLHNPRSSTSHCKWVARNEEFKTRLEHALTNSAEFNDGRVVRRVWNMPGQ